LERDPVLFWKAASIVLAAGLLVALAQIVGSP